MNSRFSIKVLAIIALALFKNIHTIAQSSNANNPSPSNYTAISTAYPFLRIMPAARSSSMGEAGIAIQPDANVLIINPAKMVFASYKTNMSISYNPWLKNIVDDMNMSYLSGYINNGKQAIGMSVRYFSVGQVEYINEQDFTIGKLNPIEYAIDLSYARKLSPSFSLAGSLRFMQSRLLLNEEQLGMTYAHSALVVDLSAYYRAPQIYIGQKIKWAAGINLTNLGPPVEDIAGSNISLPINLSVGGAATLNPDNSNEITFALDLHKLLVPIQSGSFPASIFNSFTDASGGFREELAEVSFSLGLEYWLQNKFALRTGYIYENPQKGNRRYLSFGAGIKFDQWNADLAYLPTQTLKSPLANTLKLTLMFNFGQISGYPRY